MSEGVKLSYYRALEKALMKLTKSGELKARNFLVAYGAYKALELSGLNITDIWSFVAQQDGLKEKLRRVPDKEGEAMMEFGEILGVAMLCTELKSRPLLFNMRMETLKSQNRLLGLRMRIGESEGGDALLIDSCNTDLWRRKDNGLHLLQIARTQAVNFQLSTFANVLDKYWRFYSILDDSTLQMTKRYPAVNKLWNKTCELMGC